MRLRQVGDAVEIIEGDVATIHRVMRTNMGSLPGQEKVLGYPPSHRALFERFGGIRPVIFADAFEGLAWAILGQQITVALASRMKEAVARRFGTVIDVGSHPLFVFPSASMLAGATVDELRALKLSGQKAQTLLNVAREIDTGIWDIGRMTTVSTDEAFLELTRFKGIGPWTAEYSLLRTFGHPDVLPAGDVALRRAWERITAQQTVTEAELRLAGNQWRGMKSDFAFWLWLDNFVRRPVR